MTKAIIVSKSIFVRDAKRLFPEPEWKVFAIGDALLGYRFDTIVVPANGGKPPIESPIEESVRIAWLEHLQCRLAPDGEFVYL